MPDFTVRAIEREDREQWAPLWRAYLDFYRAAESEEVTDATWARIFDPLESVHALVAERDDRLIGFSHYLFQRSTWLLNPSAICRISMSPQAVRGGGVGRALIAAVVGARKRPGRRASTGTPTRRTRSRAGFTIRWPNAQASSNTGSNRSS